MSWITILWSMLASASLTLAMLHLFIWAKLMQQWGHLSFAITAVAAAVITGMELMAMHATSIEQMAILLRWAHLPILVLWLGIVCFVRFYFDAGRSWLAWTGASLRVLALILSLTTGQNLFFSEITDLRQVAIFGGEIISIPQGTLNPWYITGPLSALVLVIFVLDAAFTIWRRGTNTDRRRAVIFSTSITFFLATSVGHAALVNAGLINSPYIVGLAFMPIVVAMAYELSYDMLRSVQITHQLQASEAELRLSEQRMNLAASAAELRLWEWDIVRDEIWSTDKQRLLFGLPKSEKISFENFLNVLHNEDRERVRYSIENALSGNHHFECEYRVVFPDDQISWLSACGRVEFDGDQPLRMHGVSIDITRRKQAELEVQLQRNELSHLSRVSLLGELSGSLAHELNQPLTAILSNAQAAQRFLALDQVNLAEVEDILTDIVAEDRRAGEIIQRLRLLLKKGEVQRLPLDVNKVVQEVLKLLRSDLMNHCVAVNVDLDQKLPIVLGDRVQLLQVLLNLIVNACEAMSQTTANKRRLTIRTELTVDDNTRVSVVDQGTGIPSERMESIFEPFFSTKKQGMGLGLAICRSIITAHGGQLRASNNDGAGANLHFTLPAYRGENT